MAQYVSGTATGPSAIQDLMLQIDALLLANGWTVHRTISTTSGARDIVYKGTALDRTADNAPFIRLTQAALLFTTRTYMDWDPTSSSGGINEAGTNNVSNSGATLSDTSFQYFIRVNGFAVRFVFKIGANLVRMYAGFLRRALPTIKNGVTKTTQAYALGVTTMNVASNMTSKLKVGQKVLVMNFAHNNASANKANAELLTIQSIASSSITFTSASTKAYDNGALIGENPYPIGTLVTATGSAITGWYAATTVDGAYVSNIGNTGIVFAVEFTSESNNDPSDAYQDYTIGPYSVYANVTNKQSFCGLMYHYYRTEGGNQGTEDLMDDGINTFLVVFVSTTTCQLLGPRE
jgi:hypothetical protein